MYQTILKADSTNLEVNFQLSKIYLKLDNLDKAYSHLILLTNIMKKNLRNNLRFFFLQNYLITSFMIF
ncbi:hypothetical protein [Aureivirga marina]|uniref:hypothetical protein n=1 Tax=Aureivirga marina TaxID=1182451 RepID=UPI00374278B9